MDGVLRGLLVYIVLLAFIRAMGNRTAGQITMFDLVLLLIISETTQQALIGEDYSRTQCIVLITTLMGADLILSIAKDRSQFLARALDGSPIILMKDGKLLRACMRRERVDESEILEAARKGHAIESLDDVVHAVLERNGEISVFPRKKA